LSLALVFERDDPARVRFAISPLWETLAALRVVLEPRRSTFHLPWLDAVRDDLDRLDPWPLYVLSPHSGWTPDFLTPPPSGPESGVADQLAAVRATPPDLVAREVRRSLTDRGGQPVPAAAWRLLDDPAATRDMLAGNLEECWRLLIEPHWPRLHDLLHADMQYRTQLLGDYGLERVLADLDPQVSWTGRALVIDMPGNARHRLAGSGLLLLPSAFIWPDVVAIVDPPARPAVVYPARGIAELWQPAHTGHFDALGRLLGRTRAALLESLAEPASTHTLARRHGLAPSTVSEHLAVLHEAGLVARRRHRHTILYHQTSLGTELASGGQAGFLTRRGGAGRTGSAAGD
jgi:DNA-binding transcriptional ArsR family regulator